MDKEKREKVPKQLGKAAAEKTRCPHRRVGRSQGRHA